VTVGDRDRNRWGLRSRPRLFGLGHGPTDSVPASVPRSRTRSRPRFLGPGLGPTASEPVSAPD